MAVESTDTTPAAQTATQTPAPEAQPARSFRDVKIRRLSDGIGKEVQKVEPPAGALGQASQEATEAAKPDTKVEPAPDPLQGKLTKEFKALHKQKQKLREREEALKANEAKIKEYDEFVALRAQDKLEAARRLGFTVKELNELAIKRPADPRVLELERRQVALEEEIKKEREEAKSLRIKSIQTEIKTDVHAFIDENREKYKHITAWDAHDEVYKTVLDFKEVYGRDPGPEDLAKVAEKVDHALRVKHEAANKRLGVTAASKVEPAAPGPRSLSTIRAVPEVKEPRHETRDERIRRLAAEYRAMSS